MESGKHLLLFILLQGITNNEAFADEEDSPFSRSAFFMTKENKRLKGHVGKRVESPSLLSCSHECKINEWCTSTNFKLSSKNDEKGTCELNVHSFIDENTEFHGEEGVTFSMLFKQLCRSSPCQNNGECVPNFASNTYRCVCRPGFTGTHCEACKFDFEDGIDGWEKTGTAFNNQPTFGDNPPARYLQQPANQQGDWWIGTYENRTSPEVSAGQFQGDGPQGTLTFPPLTIKGRTISFLIGGGGCYGNFSTRAELIIDDKVVRKETGDCNETMARKTWDVQDLIGQRARVKLFDSSSGDWGHINFDDLKGDISCEEH